MKTLRAFSLDVSLPVFQQHYRGYCARVQAGEEFTVDTAAALPQQDSEPLSKEQQLEHLRTLREELGL